MSEAYEQYIISLFKKFSPDEHREIMEMSVIAHSDEEFHKLFQREGIKDNRKGKRSK